MATVQMVGNLTAYEREILTSVNAAASGLSLIGFGFIVLCYVLFKELRKFSFKLFYLALSDMFCSFFSIVGDPSKGFFCSAQGHSTHFFCVASFLWTMAIAFTLHRTVVRHKTDVEDLESMFHLYVWGVKSVEINRKQQKVSVTGYVEPSKVLKKAKSTGKKSEIWPYVPYNLVAQPYIAGTYDKKAPPGYVRKVETGALITKYDDPYITMFSDDNPNACSVM